MAKYKVYVPFSGYIRGCREFEVEAVSSADALEIARYGDAIKETYVTMRDDTTTDWRDAAVKEMV
jgi:hypothetical protein